MGIKGLWPVLEGTAENVSLENLEGKRVAVDVSIWLYQAQLGLSPDAPSPHIHLLIRRLAKLIFYRIRPVFVFDGPSVPVFKHRILEERSMKRHADDLVVTKEKLFTLGQLTRGINDGEVVDKVIAKLRSPTKKKRRGEEGLYELPSTSRVLQDSGDEGSEEEEEEIGMVNDLMALAARREVLREQRLLPSQIPSSSLDFSQFQMQRLLGKSRLNERIEELKNASNGERVIIMSKEGRKRQHVISWDNDDDECTVIATKKGERKEEKRGMALTLDYMEEGRSIEQRRDEEEDVQRAIELSLADRGVKPAEGEWMSKSGLIEDIVRRREARRRRVSLSSESSESSELVDVPFPTVPAVSHDTPSTSKEWNPALPEDEKDRLFYGEANEEKKRDGQGREVLEYRELQEVLTVCGFPWIEAPGEAEAQCVWLANEGLVDGVVSDDSDCFAFGVSRLIRHMFNREKTIEYYDGRTVHDTLGLSKWDIITLAILSGGDYAMGLKGVGVVNALELMAIFTLSPTGNEEEETIGRLKRIEEWLLDKGLEGNSEKRRLKDTVLRSNGEDTIRGLSNEDIVRAYCRPLVDESKETFKWKNVDIERLKALLWNKLQWDEKKVEQTVMDAFVRWNTFMNGQSSYQMHLTSFFTQAKPKEKELTKRLQKALEKMKEKRRGIPNHLEGTVVESTVDEGKEEVKGRMGGNRRGRGRGERGGRGRRGGGVGVTPSQLKLSSSSSSDEDD